MTLDLVAQGLGYLMMLAALIWAVSGMFASVATFFFRRFLRRLFGRDE